ncbi:MAG: ClcB-like voltage-gated chloride channel protein [Chthoniobacterales bacterium]
MNVSEIPPAQAGDLRRLKLWAWFSELVRPNELQVNLFWAGIIGFLGAVLSVGFRQLTQVVHWLFTRSDGGYVETFAHLIWWQRLLVPALGGLLAGLALYFGTRLKAGKTSADYMEAIVLGDGVLSFRQSLVKCLSALLSIASGASIGREGPIVQLAAMSGSLVGRLRSMSAVRLRLLVACGAAAGIASAYNAPIAGALFVSEIVLRSMSMESFGPLVFSSVIATLTVRQFLGGNPLYEIAIPAVRLNSNWEMLLYLLLGLLAGLVAPLFLWSLRSGERLFARVPIPGFLRLALGGFTVGLLAIWHPEVCGNGYSVVNHILHGGYLWPALLAILLCKWLATATSFGSGAVGGVFTPTLFVGAGGGYLFAIAAQSFWPGAPLVPNAFTLVGMGALLAGTTHAPIMAIIMLFELTLDYQIILPLMLACVVAHYVSLAFEPKSIYAESLRRKGAGQFQLDALRVESLMNRTVPSVSETAAFGDIVQHFLGSRYNYLYVLDGAGAFRGAISLHDIKNYLNDPHLSQIVIADDLVVEPFPRLHPESGLSEALNAFASHDGDRLPVVETGAAQRLLGSISKNDVLLALAEQTRQDGSPHASSQ